MLQLLVCSDVHTYTDNIRRAIKKMDRVDAVLIAGDLESERDSVLAAVGDIPCCVICGNNDYYLHTDYPQELLIDITEAPENPLCGPAIGKVTELTFDSVPDTDTGSASPSDPALSSFFARLLFSRSPGLPGGLSFPAHSVKKPAGTSHRILMTHGKEYNVPDLSLLTRRAAIWDADIVIFGHTHKFMDTSSRRGKIRLINPGCLAGDPGGSVRSFGGCETCSFAALRIECGTGIHVQHLYL